MQTDASIVENSMEFPQKIKSGTAFWSSNPTSKYIFKDIQNTNLKEYKHPYVHGSIIYNRQDTEATWCPSVNERKYTGITL